MGWDYTKGATRDDVVRTLTKDWKTDRTHARCLAQHLTLEDDVTILWTVWEYTFPEANKKEPRRGILCSLLDDLAGYGWGYKTLIENSQPMYYSCPLHFLEMTPESCPEWRKRVREMHADWDQTEAIKREED